jgi:hypothetical protein
MLAPRNAKGVLERALFFSVFLDVFGVRDVFVAMVVAIDRGLAGGPRVACATAVGADGKSGQELIQVATLTGWTRDQRRLQHQQFELLTALTAPIFVNGHLSIQTIMSWLYRVTAVSRLL